jgi:UDPglucose 6-dehydrogenase
MNVTVFGTGYVGLVTGTCLAEMGNDVVCEDINAERISGLRAGKVPFFEPGLADLLRRNVEARRLRFCTDPREALADAQVAFICVGTPADEHGAAHLGGVLAVAEDLGRYGHDGLVVAVKSTVPVGTCDRVRLAICERLKQDGRSGEIHVASNPEFLKEGAAVQDFMRPDRIVFGTDHVMAERVLRALYHSFVLNGHAVLAMDVRSAEMTKYAANAMLAARVSLMNEIALLCEVAGADVMAVRKGVAADTRIGGAFLYPGVGYGGSCFPKDVRALSHYGIEHDCPTHILQAVDRVNQHQKIYLANKVIRVLGDIYGRQIGLWGLSFKPETDDVREAPALAMIKRLTDAGAEVVAYDPQGTANAQSAINGNPRVRFAASAYEAAAGCEAIVVVTEWREFRSPNFDRLKALMRRPLIFDGRNLYDPEQLRREGFEYYGIGR